MDVRLVGQTIILEDAQGKPIEEPLGDSTDLLGKILPAYDDRNFLCLRFIDRYGDTVFNYLQMETFLSEWQRLYSRVKSEAEKELLSRIEKLARRCQNERLYLKFYGD